MELPRLNVRQLMVIVVIAALDLAAGRAFLARGESFGASLSALISVAPIGLVLQAAIFRAARVRGRARAFWAGFLASSTVSTACVLGAFHDPPHGSTTISTSGITTSIYPGCLMARVVWGYYGLIYDWLERIKYPCIYPITGTGSLLTQAALGLLPHRLIAWAGGYMALACVGWFGKGYRPGTS